MGSVEQGNKIIAEFMGSPIEPQNAEYHTSWDWLMNVVEKIETSADDKTGHISVDILDRSCTIYQFEFKVIAKSYNELKIIATWEAIVQFITWYNSQTPKQNG